MDADGRAAPGPAVIAGDKSKKLIDYQATYFNFSRQSADQAVVDSQVKGDPELADLAPRELHQQIRARLAPGSTSVTDRAPVALHNAWRDLTLRRLFEQHEKAERLLSLVGSGINLELGLQALLLGFQRGST
jgi:hypothetical protein